MTARPRDRAATEAAILDAAERLLVRDGFTGLTIQSIAAEAGSDRKLVYRYFGSAEAVIEALGRRSERWLGAELPAPPADAGYAAMLRPIMRAYLAALRADPALQRLLAWELAEDSPMLRRLDQARSAAIAERLPALRGAAVPAEGVDAPAVNAVLLAALHYLVLRSRTAGGFVGLDLSGEAGWARVTAVLDRMIAAAYAPGDPASSPGGAA